MEKAIYLSDIEKLQSSVARLPNSGGQVSPQSSEYSRLYFGVEFCEWLIPPGGQVKEAMEEAKRQQMAFTLVTSYVSDAGLSKLTKLFDELSQDDQLEVVVNDFGTLRLVHERYNKFTPVLGRLLSRQKRGFGISSQTASATPDLLKHFQSSNVDNPVVADFLNSYGVRRVEIDNLLQGIKLDLSSLNMVASLYVPYGYVTTTRFCPASFDGGSWKSLEGRCKQECRGQVATLESDIASVPVYMRGNTQFFKNGKLPDDKEMEAADIDRIVFEPQIPL